MIATPPVHDETVVRLHVMHSNGVTSHMAKPFAQYRARTEGPVRSINVFDGDICGRNDSDGFWLRAHQTWHGPFPDIATALIAWCLLT